MIERYVGETTKVESIMRKKVVWRGVVNSTSQSIPFFAYAIALCYGGFLVANGEVHFKNVIKYVISWHSKENFEKIISHKNCISFYTE